MPSYIAAMWSGHMCLQASTRKPTDRQQQHVHMHVSHPQQYYNNQPKILACYTSDADADEIVKVATNRVLHVVQMHRKISQTDQSAIAHLSNHRFICCDSVSLILCLLELYFGKVLAIFSRA